MLQAIFARDVFNNVLFVKGLFVNATLPGAGHLWFVPLILLCYVLTPLMEAYRDKYINSRRSYILFSFFSVGIATLFFTEFDTFYNPAWITCYVVGYIIGINEQKRHISSKVLLALFGTVATVGNVTQIYYSFIVQKGFSGYQMFCDYNHTMLGVFLFLLMKTMFDNLRITRLGGLLNLTDTYSYEIYLVHHLIILGPFSLMNMTNSVCLNIIIILILTILMAWTLKTITNRIQTGLIVKCRSRIA